MKKLYFKSLIIFVIFSLFFTLIPTSIFASVSNVGNSETIPPKGALLKDSTENEGDNQKLVKSDNNNSTDIPEVMTKSSTLPEANVQVANYSELTSAIARAPSDGSEYIIEVIADIDITKQLVFNNKNIIIRSDSTTRTLNRGAANIYLFNITANSKLTFENIIIDGKKEIYDTNTVSLLVVQQNATLALKEGTSIQNAKSTSIVGAVYITSSSLLTMSDSKIIDNEGKNGGGIYVHKNNGPIGIQMSNSIISNNSATNSGGGIFNESLDSFVLTLDNKSKINDNTAAGNGGGVYSFSLLTLDLQNNSQINNNTTGTGAASAYYGGGIYARDSLDLNMTGSSQINKNESLKGPGGGIYCLGSAKYFLSDYSEINGNSTSTYGGGIYSPTVTNLKLIDSSISNNEAGNSGGGVYSENGFPITTKGNSKINNNSSGNFGGGIAVVSKPFIKGTIVSFEDNTEIVGNSAKSGGGFWLGNSTEDLYTLNIKDNVKIQNNTAEDHGGIYIRSGDVNISTTTEISQNKNTSTSGGSSTINVAYGQLTLKNGVVIKGNNGASPVGISNNSKITMESGSVITQNTSNIGGGGLRLSNGSTIDMKQGSIISKNTVTNNNGGGGIYIYSSGGTIAGEISQNVSADSGGGIYIHGNTKAAQTNGQPKLYIIDGAEINKNVAAYAGGGIYANGPKSNESVDPRAILYVEGGNIRSNIANGTDSLGIDSGGGGIAIARAQASISGGNITNNTAIVGAGGVQANAQKFLWYSYEGSGKLIVSGGDISDNISGTDSSRTALGIQGILGAEITLKTQFNHSQSLKVDISSTFVVEPNALLTTVGNVTLGGKSKLITFNPNGGEVVNMVNFIEESQVKMPPVSNKEGYIFGGWYDGTNIYQPNDVVLIAKDVTYKAIWKYTVTYKSGTNADVGQVDKTDTKYDDIDLTLLDDSFTRKGYRQVGWSTYENGTTTYQLGDSFTDNEVLTLYPVWEIIEYTINYDLGNTTAINNQDNPDKYTVKDNISIKEPTCIGYIFMGWTWSGQTIPQKGIVIEKGTTGNKAYVAHWQKTKYTISFDSQGGTLIKDMNVLYEETIHKPTPPKKEGYIFKGWYKEKECINEWNFEKVVNSNMVLYAKWTKENHYDISGDITGSDKLPSAYLIRNGVRYEAVVTGEKSPYKYSITDVPSGIYNLIVFGAVDTGEVTTTVLVEVKNQSIKQNIILPSSSYNSVVKIIGDQTPNVEAGGLNTIAKIIGESVPETNVSIELRIQENKKSINAQDVLEAINKDPAFMVSGIIVDLNLVKIIDKNNDEYIKEVSKREHGLDLITVVFHLPDNLKGKNDYALYRYHDEKVDKITAIANKDGEKIIVDKGKSTITAYIKKFSTYSIAYSNPYQLTVENGSGSGMYANNSVINIEAKNTQANQVFKEWVIISGQGIFENSKNPSTTFTMSTEKVVIKAVYQDNRNPNIPTETPKGETSGPDTGDTSNIIIYIGLVAVSSWIVAFIFRRKKTRNK